MSLVQALAGFSVVIPTYQRRERLRLVLEHLGRLEYPSERLEVIVVCDGSTDGSAAMARDVRLPFPVTVLEQSNQGPAAARNLALAAARGPFVLFLDDDVLPPPLFVANHAMAHEGRDDRVVIGPLLPAPGHTSAWVEWEGKTLLEQYRAMEEGWYGPTPYQFYTGNASAPLEALLRAGGFDVRFTRAEDVELALRLEKMGLTFCFAPGAAALHVADRSYSSWVRGAYQYGRNDVAFAGGQTTHTLRRVSENITSRHPALRAAIRIGLKYPAIRPFVVEVSRLIATRAPKVGARRLAEVACSLAFNFEYWRGVSDEIGDPERVQRLINLRVAA